MLIAIKHSLSASRTLCDSRYYTEILENYQKWLWSCFIKDTETKNYLVESQWTLTHWIWNERQNCSVRIVAGLVEQWGFSLSLILDQAVCLEFGLISNVCSFFIRLPGN